MTESTPSNNGQSPQPTRSENHPTFVILLPINVSDAYCTPQQGNQTSLDQKTPEIDRVQYKCRPPFCESLKLELCDALETKGGLLRFSSKTFENANQCQGKMETTLTEDISCLPELCDVPRPVAMAQLILSTPKISKQLSYLDSLATREMKRRHLSKQVANNPLITSECAPSQLTR